MLALTTILGNDIKVYISITFLRDYDVDIKSHVNINFIFGDLDFKKIYQSTLYCKKMLVIGKYINID
ncbi:hypothetical protein PIROE2DRAFT_3631 [Piromyces sp. E2]|nr:hypothetical protein PIROE2DRAFT_3631 [Piromyces sp. E2]|eukprot:OUM68637.1 hypothetical protein PIROE2DRAFT_3631 [Piromyces sp. E2]